MSAIDLIKPHKLVPGDKIAGSFTILDSVVV